MTSFGGSARVLFAAMVLALPIPATGCGRTACFQWTAEEGACPSQKEALQFFTGEGCPGKVQSVNGPGSRDGELCCYPVSQDELSPAFGGISTCNGFGGAPSGGAVGHGVVGSVGGFGGFIDVGGSGAVGGFGGFIDVGGAGGGVPCNHCFDTFQDPGSANPFCAGSITIFEALKNCLCAMGEPCEAACTDSFCSGLMSSPECQSCLTMPAPDGCQDQLIACENDF